MESVYTARHLLQVGMTWTFPFAVIYVLMLMGYWGLGLAAPLPVPEFDLKTPGPSLEAMRQNVCVVSGQPGTNAALLAVSAAKNPRRASAICARIGAPETTTSTMVSDRCVCPRARTCCVETPSAASASA